MTRARDYLLTLDAGTGSGRCVAFDAAGTPVAAAQEGFTYRVFEDPNMPFLRGFDIVPDAFWGTLARSARTVVARLPAGARIRGVIATSQREGCVILDATGEVLYAGPNLDGRAVAEGMEVQEKVGARLHAITGHAPPYIFPIARWLWFRKHGDASRAATLLMLNDWITFLLSGERVAEHSNACESMLFDVTRRAWSEELLDAFDIPRAVLPPVLAPGAPAGRVTAAAAAATGIPAGTPVFVGGADTESALLGSGVWETGETAAILGTTSPVQMVLDRPLLDPGERLWTSCHVVPDRWVLESNAGDTGDAYRWLLELFFGSTDAAAHAAAETTMAATAPAPRPLFCHFGPAIFDLSNMSPFKPAGLLFRFPLMHVDRPLRGEILRAYVENVAYAIRGNCEQLRAVSGRDIPHLTVSGGLSQSPTLTTVLADTLGIPLRVADVPESASLGSAVLAAVGAGLHATLAEAVAAMTRTRGVEPAPERVPAYDERYRKWREVYDFLQTWTM
ncbi:MAG TPA: FGGY-family carbohydrate kinase [Candidatus Binatia bacterium]|nr:FGGY-family carbohydrate kinase [Candidatus Binatia bacterium]